MMSKLSILLVIMIAAASAQASAAGQGIHTPHDTVRAKAGHSLTKMQCSLIGAEI